MRGGCYRTSACRRVTLAWCVRSATLLCGRPDARGLYARAACVYNTSNKTSSGIALGGYQQRPKTALGQVSIGGVLQGPPFVARPGRPLRKARGRRVEQARTTEQQQHCGLHPVCAGSWTQQLPVPNAQVQIQVQVQGPGGRARPETKTVFPRPHPTTGRRRAR